MGEIFDLLQTVRFADTDAAGIVYFGQYATYLDESFIAASRAKGVKWEDHQKFGFLQPIVEQKVTFYAPLRAGDRFHVAVAIIKLSERSFRSEHLVFTEFDEGNTKVVAEGYISRVVVDYDSFKPMSIPEPLLSAVKAYHIPEGEWTEYKEKMLRNEK